MKVTVTKYLNVRVGKPSLNAPNYQYLAPGSILEIDGKLYDGDAYDGITTWCKDEAGNYYWSGGVEDVSFINNPLDIFDGLKVKDLTWNIKSFNIQELWQRTKGKGVNIAILDTGCSPHPNFKDRIQTTRNFLNSSNNVADLSGHGTHVTGIIASNGNNQVFGISPEVKLHIGKVTNSKGEGLDPDVVASAIDWYSDKVDIISMSLGFQSNNTKVKKAVEKCKALIVAAYGNDGNQTRDKGDFPAEYDSCLSVGSLGMVNKNIILSKKTIRKSGLNITAPGEKINSTFLSGGFKKLSGSSMATPFVSGTLALIKSMNPDKDLVQIKNELISFSSKITQNNFTYNQINILKFLE